MKIPRIFMLDREEETGDAEMLNCLVLWLFSGFILVKLHPLLVNEGGTFLLQIYKASGGEGIYITQQRYVFDQEIQSEHIVLDGKNESLI